MKTLPYANLHYARTFWNRKEGWYRPSDLCGITGEQYKKLCLKVDQLFGLREEKLFIPRGLSHNEAVKWGMKWKKCIDFAQS